jgi:hypothetical protein
VSNRHPMARQHDGNLDGSDFTDAGMPAEKPAKMNAWMVGVYDHWNTMECDRGKVHGFACVGVYHAFNGPKQVTGASASHST